MKKLIKLKNKPAQTALITLIICMISLTLPAVADDPQNGSNSEIQGAIKIGWKAGMDRLITGYKMEKYGWIGASFTRYIAIYEQRPCCFFTGKKIDGCSAPSKCNK